MVVAIIAVLVGIAMLAGDAGRKVARDNKRANDIAIIRLKLETYRDQKGVYPAKLSQLVPTYMSSIPSDPSPGIEYQYAGLTFSTLTGTDTASCLTYHLGTTFETNGSVLSKRAGQEPLGNNLDKHYQICDGSNPDILDGTTDKVYDVVSPDAFQKINP